MKLINILASVSLITFVVGCSYSKPPTIEQPPQKINGNAPLILPEVGKTGSQTITESAAAAKNESEPTKFKVISEQKGPGGAVNRVNVDNPDGGMPDYYLSPNNNIPQTTNNNPDKLSTPNWQFSW